MRWQDLFDLLLAHPEVWETLRTSVLLKKAEGRPRRGGEWALVYLAYANTAEREVRRWHQCAPAEMWERAGFASVPSYFTVYDNFRALEAHEAAFRQVSARLVTIAVEKSGGNVGHAVHVDGTEAETNSRLVHDCTRHDSECGLNIKVPRRAHTAVAQDERHALAIEEPTDKELLGEAEQIVLDERGRQQARTSQDDRRCEHGAIGSRAPRRPV